uniref:Uncharacterized protein n=1 Tax=Anguilla anguilla TaxID=7936 RepID=A0A0E9VWM3_ANGAN
MRHLDCLNFELCHLLQYISIYLLDILYF